MTTKKTDLIHQSILDAIQRSPGRNPSGELQKRFGIGREAMRKHFQKLIDNELIVESGYGKGRVYAPGRLFTIAKSICEIHLSYMDLAQRGEDEIFKQEIQPFIEGHLSKSAFSRVQYAATECLNNVIDHSHASQIKLTMILSSDEFHLGIDDDGKGVFATLQEYFLLKNSFEAAGELAKGKRTTAPEAHAGEGLFFSARIADHFIVEANGIQYVYVESQDDWAIAPFPDRQIGSCVGLKFKIDSEKTAKAIFDRYTVEYSFKIKSPRLVNAYVIALPSGNILSRSEAKKILAGAEEFASIVLDFKQVESVGQGFADEVFRVFQNRFPGISIEEKNANEFILRMIAHVRDTHR